MDGTCKVDGCVSRVPREVGSGEEVSTTKSSPGQGVRSLSRSDRKDRPGESKAEEEVTEGGSRWSESKDLCVDYCDRGDFSRHQGCSIPY